MLTKIFSVAIILLSTTLLPGLCIRCYECERCSSAQPLKAVDCPESANTTCAKMTIAGIIKRSCSKVVAEPCVSESVFEISSETCYCAEDLCNDSEKTTGLSTLVPVITATIINLFYSSI